MKAVILAAGQGSRLLPLTADRPKCLIDFAGRTLLDWQLDMLAANGVTDVCLVTGFRDDQVAEALARREGRGPRVETRFNPFYKVADNLGSLWIARDALVGDCLILNGDTLVSRQLVKRVIAGGLSGIVVTVDEKDAYDADDMKVVRTEDGRLLQIGKRLGTAPVNAESIGFIALHGEGAGQLLDEVVERMMRTPEGSDALVSPGNQQYCPAQPGRDAVDPWRAMGRGRLPRGRRSGPRAGRRVELNPDWLAPPSLKAATGVQRAMALAVEQEDRIDPVTLIAGADASMKWRDSRGPVHAAIAPLRWPAGEVRGAASATVIPRFPYVSGYLAFREVPGLLAAWRQLVERPQLLFVDGHGRSHPRRLGIATHAGLVLDVPTIGLAKTILCGKVDGALGEAAGDHAPLVDRGETVGWALRTRPRCAPIYVSAGHRVSLETALEWASRLIDGRRILRPIRLAHDAANARADRRGPARRPRSFPAKAGIQPFSRRPAPGRRLQRRQLDPGLLPG